VVLTLAGFLGVSGLLRRIAPWPHEYGMRAKFEYLRDHREDFDTLFVGSSSTFYGVMPRRFDELTAAAGVPTRSFNLGVGGMTALEGDHFLTEVLALDLPDLRWVFVESEFEWEARIWDWRNAWSPRSVNWHCPEHSLLALRCLHGANPEAPDADAWRSLREGWTHVGLAVRKATGLTQGPRIASALFGLDRERVQPSRAELEAEHGFVDLDQLKTPEAIQARKDFLRESDAFVERVRHLEEQNGAAIPVDVNFSRRGIELQVERVRAHGADPLYYIGPRDFPRAHSYRLAEAGVIPALFGFNQPSRYPELYEVDNRLDRSHLDRDGAEHYTRYLARAFVEHLADH
jgi:hypothetical protein